MSSVPDLIHHYGLWFYLLTFVWTALEGETFVLFAAWAAQRGLLNIEALFAAAWLGSVCGDQVFFWLGRTQGVRLLGWFPRAKPRIDKALAWLEHHATGFILSYRFLYGLRNISGFAVGLSHLGWKRFTVLNVIAGFLWAAAFCAVGYAFGDVLEHLGPHREEAVGERVHTLTLAALGLFLFLLGARWALTRLVRILKPPRA